MATPVDGPTSPARIQIRLRSRATPRRRIRRPTQPQSESAGTKVCAARANSCRSTRAGRISGESRSTRAGRLWAWRRTRRSEDAPLHTRRCLVRLPSHATGESRLTMTVDAWWRGSSGLRSTKQGGSYCCANLRNRRPACRCDVQLFNNFNTVLTIVYSSFILSTT